MRSRETMWCITAGGFLAGVVCMFIPVGWTTFHSASALRVFAWAELAVGVAGLVALIVTRKKVA
jgi:hypothetical protein